MVADHACKNRTSNNQKEIKKVIENIHSVSQQDATIVFDIDEFCIICMFGLTE